MNAVIPTSVWPAIASLWLLVLASAASAENHTDWQEVPLQIEEIPVDKWSKNRLAAVLDDNTLRITDQGEGPFNDATFWEIHFAQDIPYGPKELHFDITVGPNHQPMWGNKLLQPIVNGTEARPALTAEGMPSAVLEVSESDGKGFLTAQSAQVSLQIATSDTKLSTLGFMTAGASGYDLTLSNFRIRVRPETDDRVWPQRPLAATLGYQAGRPVTVFVDWHGDAETLARQSVEVRLTGPDGTRTLNVILPKQAAAISGSRVSRINLGPLPAGEYTLHVPATGPRTTAATKTFVVQPDTAALQTARDDAWAAFYWITNGPHGPYPAAHLQDAKAQVFGTDDMFQDVQGGWFDAGDYGKYTVNGAYSAALMLLTGLHMPEALSHPIDPVGNAPATVPDWLRVVDSQLGWLAKMQGPDGAAYHKATTQKWPAMSTPPEDDRATKWLMPVTTTATADFAATMALAARIYTAQQDPSYQNKAHKFEQAAGRAIDWLLANPSLQMIAPRYDGDQYGGPYDDTNDTDERFFAFASYAALTQKPEDIARVETLLPDFIARAKSNGFSTFWQETGVLGLWALLGLETLSPNAQQAIKDGLRTAAYRWRVTQRRASWRIAVEDAGQVDWGSNGMIATRAWHWLMWAGVTEDASYTDAARDHVQYLFGLNPLGQTYVTGPFPNASAAPHFRPWTSGRIDLPPGFITGGPNSTNLAGDPVTGAISSLPPLRMYADRSESYATNEVAINWQSAWALTASLLVHATLTAPPADR